MICIELSIMVDKINTLLHASYSSSSTLFEKGLWLNLKIHSLNE